jgi:hypothetical protein
LTQGHRAQRPPVDKKSARVYRHHSGRGKIAALRDQDGLRTFIMEFPEGFCQDLAIGASVSHDGVCLTVTENSRPPAPALM